MKTTLHLNYATWIITVTGKWHELIETKSGTMLDLISELDEKYPGFKDIFIPPDVKELNVRTMVLLRRAGQHTRPIIDPNEKLLDGDTLLFY
jgi:hypothetical protein